SLHPRDQPEPERIPVRMLADIPSERMQGRNPNLEPIVQNGLRCRKMVLPMRGHLEYRSPAAHFLGSQIMDLRVEPRLRRKGPASAGPDPPGAGPELDGVRFVSPVPAQARFSPPHGFGEGS